MAARCSRGEGLERLLLLFLDAWPTIEAIIKGRYGYEGASHPHPPNKFAGGGAGSVPGPILLYHNFVHRSYTFKTNSLPAYKKADAPIILIHPKKTDNFATHYITPATMIFFLHFYSLNRFYISSIENLPLENSNFRL